MTGVLAFRAAPVFVQIILVTATSLSAQTPSSVFGTIVSAQTNAPIAGAAVRVAGGQQVAVTRGDGTYRLRLPPGRYELNVTAIGFAPLSHVMTVVQEASARLDFSLHSSAVRIDEVITIGTRRHDRTVTQSPVPIDVITSEAMEATGLVETWQMLQRLVPSVNVPHFPRGDNHMRPITLRGLAPDQVLVLVNGKRRHSAAEIQGGPVLSGATAVDLTGIPAGAIERIEVLRDGAAAQYGSDAIAGVVNIVLKSGEAEHLKASYGRALTTEHGRQFRDGKVLDVNATYGTQFVRGGRVTLSAEVRDRDGTNRAYPDARQQYFTGDPRNASPAVISSHEGNGKARDVGMFVNAMLPLSPKTELYAFGGGMHRDGRAAGPTFRRPNEVRTVRAIHPDGFLSETESRILNFSGVVGARGKARGWRWELSSAFGGNSVRYDVHNSNNVTLGAASPTDFYVGTLRSRQWTSNLDFSRQLNVRAGTPINFGVGAEFRLDTYGIEAGEPDSHRDGGVLILDGDSIGRPGPVGAQGMLGFRPIDEVDATRNNVAAYVDVDGRITRRLLLNVAGRTERYSDHGSSLDGKVAARLELLTGFALRAAAATGFRAPSLNQSYFSATRGILRLVNGVNTSFIIRTLPVGSQEAQILGATPLRPETSRNFSGGIVMDFPRFPTVTADYYAIDVDDRIVPSGEFVHPSVARLFEEHGLRGIAGGRYFTNAIDTKTRGVDVVMNYGMLVGASGLLRFTGGYNKTKTRVTRVAAAPPQLAAFQSVLFNRAERGKIEVGQPRQTITLAANYSMNRIGLNLHNQRFGQASLLDLSDPLKDQTVRAKWITDAGISYQLRPRLTVAATASNLFDIYPDEWWDFKDGVNAQGMSMFGVFRYPGGISPFGMNGRTVYVHLSYR